MRLRGQATLWQETDLSEIPKAYLELAEARLIASYRRSAARDRRQE
jgi:hypothetical protein